MEVMWEVSRSSSWLDVVAVFFLFLFVQVYLESFCFLIFTFFTTFLVTFIWFNVPETNNLSPLEIQEAFRQMHAKTEKGGGSTPRGTSDNDIHGLNCQTKL